MWIGWLGRLFASTMEGASSSPLIEASTAPLAPNCNGATSPDGAPRSVGSDVGKNENCEEIGAGEAQVIREELAELIQKARLEEDDQDVEDMGPESATGVYLGFFEVEEEDEEDEEEVLDLHKDGNWLNWDDGIVGGEQPIWLQPFENGETMQQLVQCSKCNRAMSFFFEIYAPVEEFAHAFHRTLFVFVCRNASCNANTTVLRNQLPVKNNYYKEDCIDRDIPFDCLFDHDSIPKLELGAAFPKRVIVVEPEPATKPQYCALCGEVATKRCASCQSLYYCCKEHQEEHWPAHKQLCKAMKKELAKDDDDENDESTPTEEGDKPDTEYTQADFNKLVAGENEEIEKRLNSKDEVFDSFQDRISRDPAQCIRYCKWPENTEDEDANTQGPLWLASVNQCTSIPDCELCGAPRKFEAQVLPQSLHFLNELEMDFGTICLYTCTKSCSAPTGQFAYMKEFAYVQHVEQS
mmetsp:Transcript_36865/g.59772  ORF Transcript_36865/g.59772 Transcript_36865/m.59772 type:complete len:466 (-) Transcript_36865:815-2212(-)